MLKGKNILLGITGGIAAYKTPLLVRAIRKAGGSIRAVLSESAKEFVTPMTLATLTGGEVIIGTFPKESENTLTSGTWHITLSQWADVLLIAPATANTIAKLAHGYADNAVTTLALAVRCPVVVSPAMDTDMLEHPATEANLTALREQGYVVLPPAAGELASGLVGPGRLPEMRSIVKALEEVLAFSRHDLRGKKIVVSAGPTHEAIDPVRYIGNRSSGKMGFAIARAASLRGAEVTLVSGPVALSTPRGVKRIDVESAEQMYQGVVKEAKKSDVVIMAAAVADFTPKVVVHRKIKKQQFQRQPMTLELKKTKDILQHLSETKPRNILVGFSLETDRDIYHA
ncbi:MAG TPA: bifunctional phosphopantothenoylcysteine decarboxylase/phosphopantothenate--cysteine ligase CoaBC, partial [Bacteroidota bacterium]|nr:bifunctional phosphopantothenoylcysteine decarboxylase/phosphopantothenate--cysteine ligase CoaBC [Bacteroidota bacterium]